MFNFDILISLYGMRLDPNSIHQYHFCPKWYTVVLRVFHYECLLEQLEYCCNYIALGTGINPWDVNTKVVHRVLMTSLVSLLDQFNRVLNAN